MRKTILALSVVSLIFLGCRDKQNKNEKGEQEKTAQNANMAGEGSAWKSKIQLNDDKPWEANRETTDGVRKMEAVVKAYPKKSLESFHKMAKELNEVKNYVIKECTMEGKSHDNLHIWLEPLLEKIKILSEIDSLEKAEKITEEIREHLKAYHEYFI